jgi:hypothetical protein
MGLVVHGGGVDAAAAQQGEAGARASAPALPWMVRAARRSSRPLGVRGPVLRPPCMRQRSLPWIAGGAAGAARAGAGAAAGGEVEVGVAAGFFVGAGSGGAAMAAGEGCGIGALLANVRSAEGIIP